MLLNGITLIINYFMESIINDIYLNHCKVSEAFGAIFSTGATAPDYKM